MLRNIMTDPRWENEDMGMIGDKIGKYGCFVTSLANILEITPEEMNKRFQIDNVYNGVQYPGEESEINYMRARRTLGISFRLIKSSEIELQHIENIVLCYKSNLSPSGIHFVNCLNLVKTGINVFDVYDGREKIVLFTQIIGAYALTK